MNSKNTLLIFLSFFTCAQTVDAMLVKATKPLSFKYMQHTKKLTNCNQYKSMQLNIRDCTTKSDAIIQSTSKGHLPYVGMALLTTGTLLYLDYLASNEHYGLCGAAADNDISTVKMLIKLGKDVNQAKSGNCTPLSIASASGHTEIENLLLNAGAKKHCSGCHSHSTNTRESDNIEFFRNTFINLE